jgi:transcriptional regulator with PAS, ATPase and Fis domain
VLAATNKDLQVLIEENKFREDLFYRLNVIPLHIQPLRERIEDIDDLIYMFINKYSTLFNKYFTKIDKNVIEALKLYNWPGNVRELENSIEFMINMMNQNGVLDLKTLPNQIINYNDASELSMNKIKSALTTLKELEETEIKKAIVIYGLSTSGKKLIAKKLGIGIATLYRKLLKMNI